MGGMIELHEGRDGRVLIEAPDLRNYDGESMPLTEPRCRDCRHCTEVREIDVRAGTKTTVGICAPGCCILDEDELEEPMRVRARTCGCDPEEDARPDARYGWGR